MELIVNGGTMLNYIWNDVESKLFRNYIKISLKANRIAGHTPLVQLRTGTLSEETIF